MSDHSEWRFVVPGGDSSPTSWYMTFCMFCLMRGTQWSTNNDRPMELYIQSNVTWRTQEILFARFSNSNNITCKVADLRFLLAVIYSYKKHLH